MNERMAELNKVLQEVQQLEQERDESAERFRAAKRDGKQILADLYNEKAKQIEGIISDLRAKLD